MPKITTAPATLEDSRPLFEWRNDPITREMFFDQNKISWEDHQKWFSSTLKNSNRLIVIGTVENKKIGMVRFDIDSENNKNAAISLNINPNHRGQKLAPQLLLASEKHTPKQVTTLIAEIKSENTASIKSFQKAEFTFKLEQNKNVIYEKKLGNRK